MGLSDNEKADAKSAIALALELNEPEAMLESLRRACERKANEPLLGDSERNRWQAAAHALGDVVIELNRANAPQAKATEPVEPNFSAEQSQHTDSQDIQSD